VNSLVAIDMPANKSFVDALQSIWSAGDAALPLDQRLPLAMRRNLVQRFEAAAVIDSSLNTTRLPKSRPVEPGDAMVVATSGSTGEPKGAVHTHASIKAAVDASSQRLGCDETDHWLACISLAHVGGLSVVLRALQLGSGLTVSDKTDQTAIDRALADGATMVAVVPTMLKRLALGRFKKVLVGGSEIDFELPANAIATYGLTETFGGVVYDSLPLDGVEIRIAEDSGIEVKSPSCMRCYRDGSNPFTEDHWLPTGDLGRLEDGRLTVEGRSDDQIKTGGYKVWPHQVERVISAIDGVADCVVRGVPDAKWGQAVSAWIVVADSSRGVALEDIRKHVKNFLPDYCAPRFVQFLDRIPRSPLGKVLLSELPEAMPKKP